MNDADAGADERLPYVHCAPSGPTSLLTALKPTNPAARPEIEDAPSWPTGAATVFRYGAGAGARYEVVWRVSGVTASSVSTVVPVYARGEGNVYVAAIAPGGVLLGQGHEEWVGPFAVAYPGRPLLLLPNFPCDERELLAVTTEGFVCTSTDYDLVVLDRLGHVQKNHALAPDDVPALLVDRRASAIIDRGGRRVRLFDAAAERSLPFPVDERPSLCSHEAPSGGLQLRVRLKASEQPRWRDALVGARAVLSRQRYVDATLALTDHACIREMGDASATVNVEVRPEGVKGIAVTAVPSPRETPLACTPDAP